MRGKQHMVYTVARRHGLLKMNWFHCNRCFTKRGSKFAVSSCGHICCEACITPKQCSVCGVSCSYLAITDEVDEATGKIVLQGPHGAHPIALFQRTQMEMITAHFKHKFSELERHLKEVTELDHRKLGKLKGENAELKQQLLELKRENAELRKPLSQMRVSRGSFQIDGSQRVSLPVAVTPPVTPHSRSISYLGSSESQGWARDRGPSLSSLTTPGPAASVSRHSSLQENLHRTPTSFSSSARTHRQTPNAFQFHFTSDLSTQSPSM
ncbi:RING finger protein 212B-like isoform X2 [Betta splendens]|uniref:RING finger protein 212B-like isoform X2 n=1 Tax=Betta splendens TaxID=158456 RepID=A0A8M1H6U2_BETSP|nr:RING finger protein 212B-like isoform X2 [Betta splendens]